MRERDMRERDKGAREGVAEKGASSTVRGLPGHRLLAEKYQERVLDEAKMEFLAGNRGVTFGGGEGGGGVSKVAREVERSGVKNTSAASIEMENFSDLEGEVDDGPSPHARQAGSWDTELSDEATMGLHRATGSHHVHGDFDPQREEEACENGRPLVREHILVRREEPRADGRLLVSPRKTEPHSQVCVCVCVCVFCVCVCVCCVCV